MSRLLEALNDRQRAAVTNTEGPLLVIAGAGSGKTRVLTHRLSYIISEGLARPWEVLAMTFTNKAAGEMKERISSLLGLDVSRMWISTFHSFCARFLRMEAEHLGYPSNFTILDDSDSKSLVSRCLKELGISGTQFTPASVLRKISSAKNLLYDAEKFASEAEGFYDERTAQVFTLYEQKLRSSAAFDFDDLLSMAVKLLDEHDTVRKAWQNRFRYLLVDEYQDTNHAQYNLLLKLVNESKNICVVGDEDQSIYGWRGADISNILGFEEDFPGAEVVKLEQNYRSTQTILSAASAVIKNNSARKDKTLWTEIDGGEKITIALNETQSEEADWVIDRVLGQTDKFSLSDMVILYRTNAQSRSFEESLRRRNTPYQIIGGLSFYQRKEIKDLIAYMKLVSNPCDEASFVRIINFPKRALGDTSLAKLTILAKRSGISLLQAASEAATGETLGPRARKGFVLFAELIAELKKQADTLPVDEFIQAVIDETALGDALVADDPVSGEARLENMQEFISAAAEFFTSNPEPTLDNFLAEITLYAGTDSYQESDEKLTMMTLHNAKGLEFDAVFVTGMEDGLFPLARTFDDPNELEEERRLLYVGATRARKQLTLTMAHQRRRYNGTESPPSRFLKEIPPELVDKIDRRAYKWDFGPTRTTGARRSTGKPLPDKKPAALEGVYYEYEDEQGVRPGQTVLHPKFGHGRVIAVDGLGEDMRVDVDFASYGLKKLVAKYARLTVISK